MPELKLKVGGVYLTENDVRVTMVSQNFHTFRSDYGGRYDLHSEGLNYFEGGICPGFGEYNIVRELSALDLG